MDNRICGLWGEIPDSKELTIPSFSEEKDLSYIDKHIAEAQNARAIGAVRRQRRLEDRILRTRNAVIGTTVVVAVYAFLVLMNLLCEILF